MIRLAIIPGSAGVFGDQLAIRLHGATVSVWPEPPPDCDAVLVIYSAPKSIESVALWLEAGKHVLLLGRYCTSKAALCTVHEAANRGGASLMIANPMRYWSSRRLIREQLDAGKLGDVGLLRSHAWRPIRATEMPDHEKLPAAIAPSIDLAMWLVGKPIERIFAISRSSDNAVSEGKGLMTVHLAFAGGAMAVISVANSVSKKSYSSLSVIGSSGAAYSDNQHDSQLLLLGADKQVAFAGEGHPGLANMVQAFVDGLNAGPRFVAGVDEWRNVLDVVEEVQRSLESRQAILREGG